MILDWIVQNVPSWVLVAGIVGMLGWIVFDFIRRFEFEEIACVAIKYDDIGVLALPAPARHHHVMWTRLFIDGKGTPGSAEQGFLTTSGRFVGRKLAFKIAEKRGQIVKAHAAPNLFSEDMWDTPPEARDWRITNENDE